jgi:hypothetical protein
MTDKAGWDRDQTIVVKEGKSVARSDLNIALAKADPDGVTKVRHAPAGYPELADERLRLLFEELDREFLKASAEEYRDDRLCIDLANEIQAAGLYPPAEQRWHVASFNVNVPSSELLDRNGRFIETLRQMKAGEQPDGLATTKEPPSEGSVSRHLSIALFNQATQLLAAEDIWAAVGHARGACEENDGGSAVMSVRRRLSLAGMLSQLVNLYVDQAKAFGLSETEFAACLEEATEEYAGLSKQL